MTSPHLPPKEINPACTGCTGSKKIEVAREVIHTREGKDETLVHYDDGSTLSSINDPPEFLKATAHPCGHFDIALELLEAMATENKALKAALAMEEASGFEPSQTE